MATNGLFLDFDGTLVDSLGVMRNVYERFLAGHGAAPSDAEFDVLNGPPLDKVVALIKERHHIPDRLQDMLETYRSLISGAYLDVRPVDGALDLVRRASASGWTLAVVTSAPHKHVSDWLRRQNIADLIAEIVSGEDVQKGKPDPEPYQIALERTGCIAAASWAVEDSPTGARAARGAGLRTAVLVSDRRAVTWPDRVEMIRSLDEMVERLEQAVS